MPRSPKQFGPDPAERFFVAGVQWMQLGRYKEAFEAFSQFLQAAPESAKGYDYLARASYTLGQLAKAVQLAKKALSLDPTNAYPPYILGLCHFKLNEMDEAEKWFKQAIEINPGNPSFWSCRAGAFLVLGNLDMVEQYAGEALRIQPNHAFALNYKAQAAIRRGDLSTAKDYIARALLEEPEESYHQVVAGEIAGIEGDGERSKLYIASAIQNNPTVVAPRVAYLNLMFSKTALSSIYHQDIVWDRRQFAVFLLILLGVGFFLLPFQLAKAPAADLVLAPLLLVFGLYALLPTLYRVYKSWQLWGRHGVIWPESPFPILGFLLCTALLALAFYLQKTPLYWSGMLLVFFFFGTAVFHRLGRAGWKTVITIVLFILAIGALLLVFQAFDWDFGELLSQGAYGIIPAVSIFVAQLLQMRREKAGRPKNK